MAMAHPKPAHPQFKDRTGETFGRLTVIAYAGRPGKFTLWTCRCECGTVVTVRAGSLQSGNTTSCGCFHRETMAAILTRHGQCRRGQATSEFSTWQTMLARCHTPTSKAYAQYGGRGIVVCDRWRESFEAFFADMGPKPSPRHSIDRYPDQNGPYSPENCRWATMREQNRNRRSNRLLTCRGETKTIVEWSESTGTPYATIRGRLRLGWSDEAAVFTPARILKRKPR